MLVEFVFFFTYHNHAVFATDLCIMANKMSRLTAECRLPFFYPTLPNTKNFHAIYCSRARYHHYSKSFRRNRSVFGGYGYNIGTPSLGMTHSSYS